MDLKKLTRGEMVIGISGIVLFIASFLPWFEVDLGFVSADGNGWDMDFLVGPLPVILGVLMVVHVALSKFAPQVTLPEAPWGTIHLVVGIVVGALLLLKLLIGEEAGPIDADRSFGLFLAVLAGIGLAVGGWFYKQEHGTTPPTTL